MFSGNKTTKYWASSLGSTARRLICSAGNYVGVAIVSVALIVAPADAELSFGIPSNLGPGVNTANLDAGQTVSPDGLELFFTSDRAGGLGGLDIWVLKRAAVSDPWSPPVNLGAPVNSEFGDGTPSISSDGLSLYFSSYRAGGYGNYDLWVTTRATTSAPWGTPANLGPTVNSIYDEIFPSISSDGLELYFSDWVVFAPSGYGDADIWVTTRSSVSEPWGPPSNLGLVINTSYYDAGPYISNDRLSLYFSSERPGGYGLEDVWVATRATISEPWAAPANLGSPVNSSSYDALVCFSPDSSILYFGSSRGGGFGDWDLWQVPVFPAPACGDDEHPYPTGDLSKNCRVDFFDLAILLAHWLEDNNP